MSVWPALIGVMSKKNVLEDLRELPAVGPLSGVVSRTMTYRLTGVSSPFSGASWETVPGDGEVARAVIRFLEDRRLLFGQRHAEDERHCVASALQIRKFHTTQITREKPGKDLERCLEGMRTSFRHFMERGGPDGRNFTNGYHYVSGVGAFQLFIKNLRNEVGLYFAYMLSNYSIDVSPELRTILPKLDAY